MLIFRYQGPKGFCIGIEIDGMRFDLSSAGAEFADLSTWLALPDPLGSIRAALPVARILPLVDNFVTSVPIDRQEVWASGVTYLRSKVARMEESEEGGDFYDRVYDAERPELFFKSTADRVVGDGGRVRIRRDSTWNVPEPELVLVLSSSGEIVGYTIGNDMSSRSIEGENPLYLPQAKVYDGSCSIGPMILLDDGGDVVRVIRMSISRDGSTAFEGETSTGQIRRPLTELADYLFREMSFPNGVFLFTGTGIVPPDEFTLRVGDMVEITIDGIGILVNTVA